MLIQKKIILPYLNSKQKKRPKKHTINQKKGNIFPTFSTVKIISNTVKILLSNILIMDLTYATLPKAMSYNRLVVVGKICYWSLIVTNAKTTIHKN
jgi:hypothetical protein